LTRRRVVVATSNPGKVAEIDAILADPGLELVSLEAFPAVSVPEECGDYAANAIAKAKAAASQLGEIAVADDSGLEVDALGGAPGPYSARFGGLGLDDRGRVDALLAELETVVDDERGARFVCIAALATPSGEGVSRRGECAGSLLRSPRGESGFGYDPIFQLAGSSRTMAELSSEEKNRISHRARAFTELMDAVRRA
jgi:XTP/dITP diphosphohydrolase